MNIKAQKFNEYLSDNGIEKFFQVEEVENDVHPVLYRSFMEVSGQNLPAMLVIDDSIYVMLQVRVGSGLVNDKNKLAVLNHINQLNDKFKVFKYYVAESGDIVIESCIPSSDEKFVPDMVHAVINIIFDHLGEEYPKLMKTVWAE